MDRHDGWIYVFGSQFGKKDGPLQPKRSFVARFREADVRHVLEPPAAPWPWPGRRSGSTAWSTTPCATAAPTLSGWGRAATRR